MLGKQLITRQEDILTRASPEFLFASNVRRAARAQSWAHRHAGAREQALQVPAYQMYANKRSDEGRLGIASQNRFGWKRP